MGGPGHASTVALGPDDYRISYMSTVPIVVVAWIFVDLETVVEDMCHPHVRSVPPLSIDIEQPIFCQSLTTCVVVTLL